MPSAPSMKAVNAASTMYANALNANALTPVIQNLLNASNAAKPGFIAAPYIFINTGWLDYEKKSKKYGLVRYNYTTLEPGFRYDIENDLDALSVQIPEDVCTVWKMYNLVTKHKRFAGLMGINIMNPDVDIDDMEEDEDYGQHYVAYVFDDGKFSFFDSGAPSKCTMKEKRNNTYIILTNALKKMMKAAEPTKPLRLITSCNKKVFETAAGASEDENNYIGQNIFCHSWSLWFLYQFVVNGITLKEIDEFAGRGKERDLNNLLLIKTFVYSKMIPIAGLDKLYKSKPFGNFRYYIHDENYESGLSEEKMKERKKKRNVRLIPALM